jgi:hypothetical protein
MNCSRCGAPHECGTIAHTGQGKIAVLLSADQLEELALATPTLETAQQLLCALGLLDAARADMARHLRNEAWAPDQFIEPGGTR